MRRLLLVGSIATVAVFAGCGGGSADGLTRRQAIARAGTICQNAAIPGIPFGGQGLNSAVRMAQLTGAQERREIERLRAIGWDDDDFQAALAVFSGSLVRLERFVRAAHGGHPARVQRERAAYDRAIGEWQSRTAALGLDVCSRYGFAF